MWIWEPQSACDLNTMLCIMGEMSNQVEASPGVGLCEDLREGSQWRLGRPPVGQVGGASRRGCRHQSPGCWEPGGKKLSRCRPGSQDPTLPVSSTHGCSRLWVGEPAAGYPMSSKHVEGMGLSAGLIAPQASQCPPCLSMLGTAQGQFLTMYVGVGICVVLREMGMGEGAQD